MRLISNSEVSSWLECRRKYYYAYVLDLEPVEESAPLTKGTLIHAMLEQYYIGKASGLTEAECRREAMEPLMVAARVPHADISDLGTTRDLIMAYFEHYMEQDEKYEIFAVETQMKLDMVPDNYAMTGTLDLIWKDTTDNRYVVMDHKSSYNFWSQAQADISGQPIKYLHMARESGLDVKGAVINQIRTRTLKEGNELFRRTPVHPSEAMIKNVMIQHTIASEEIMNFREKADKNLAVPRYDKYACANCDFIELCNADSNGAPIQYQIKSEFRIREGYGYNHREVPE